MLVNNRWFGIENLKFILDYTACKNWLDFFSDLFPKSLCNICKFLILKLRQTDSCFQSNCLWWHTSCSKLKDIVTQKPESSQLNLSVVKNQCVTNAVKIKPIEMN